MNGRANVLEVTLDNFQQEVVERSRQLPVLLEIYAAEARQSQAQAQILLRLAEAYQGKFLLARVNVATNQPLVQQLQVRTLPTCKLIIQGRIVQNLEGHQDEPKLRALLDQATQSPLERVRAQISELVANGERSQAIELLQQVIEAEPRNFGLHTELCDLLIMVGRADEAEEILAALPKDAPGIDKPRYRLEFLRQCAKLEPASRLESRLQQNPADHQARFDLAIRQIVDDDMEAALEGLLFIMQRDRAFGEDLARLTMIKVFELLGKGDGLATRYRRRMFALMH